MADMNSTATRAAPRPRTRSTKASEAVPMYGAGAGVLSFRHRLRARERGVIDRALEIVGRCLRDPGVLMVDPDV